MLHTLATSPFQCDYTLLLRMLQQDDDLLLMQDGVIAGLQGSKMLALLLKSSVRIWALNEDLLARGLVTHISPKITIIDYNDFVILTINHKQQMLW